MNNHEDEVKRFVRARKLTPFQYGDRPVYSVTGDYGEDGYFRCVHDILESYAWLLQGGKISIGDLPEYCNGAIEIPLPVPSVDRIIEDATEEMYDDAADDINAKSKVALEEALEAFAKANAHVFSYEEDRNTVVLLFWDWLPKALGTERWAEVLKREGLTEAMEAIA